MFHCYIGLVLQSFTRRQANAVEFAIKVSSHFDGSATDVVYEAENGQRVAPKKLVTPYIDRS